MVSGYAHEKAPRWASEGLTRQESILVGKHDRNHRLGSVAGSANGLEGDKRRRALSIVVANVDAIQDGVSAVAGPDGVPEHEHYIPKPSRFVLALHTVGNLDVLGPNGAGQGDRELEPGLGGDGRNVHQHAVL